MGKIKFLIIHCSATPEGRVVTADQIKQFHQGPEDQKDGTVKYKGKMYKSRAVLPNEKIGNTHIKYLDGRGWDREGYSDLISLDGSIINLTPYDNDDDIEAWELTYGAVGTNLFSRHICYVGGCANDGKLTPKDTRTKEQLKTMSEYCHNIVKNYPNILIAGHRQFAQKACPSFDTIKWLSEIGIPEKNIYKGKYKN